MLSKITIITLVFGMVLAGKCVLQGGGQPGEDPQITKAVADIHSALKAVEEDVDNGPSDQLEVKLDKYIKAVAHGVDIGDKALIPLYQAIDQAKKEGNQQALQGLKLGVDEARNNWNGLLAADNRALKVVNEKMDRLHKVVDAIEAEKMKHELYLEEADKVLPS